MEPKTTDPRSAATILRLSRALLVGLALLLLAPPAWSAGRQSIVKARQAFSRGVTQYRLGNFEKALEELTLSLELNNRASTIFNIAQCHRQLGNTKKAVFFYKLYLSESAHQAPGKPPPFGAEAERHIAALEAELARARQELEARDRRPASSPVLKPEAPPSPGVSDPSPAPAPKRRRIWTWVLAAGTVATAAAGLGVGLWARSEFEDNRYTEDTALQDSIRAKGLAANILFGAAGALAITTVVVFFVEGRSARKDRGGSERAGAIRIAPLAGALWGGTVMARF